MLGEKTDCLEENRLTKIRAFFSNQPNEKVISFLIYLVKIGKGREFLKISKSLSLKRIKKSWLGILHWTTCPIDN